MFCLVSSASLPINSTSDEALWCKSRVRMMLDNFNLITSQRECFKVLIIPPEVVRCYNAVDEFFHKFLPAAPAQVNKC